ncbi:TlyA family RNA methyltransferase [Alkalicoccus luteus]|uniref:TlyA family RNA methyltransferase n=1 Tax=Alkalicoccus luteus TaxID=1237094 RepID=A0A969TTG1_9BACI|nr:TlyA family RNA methyltransferase [Alkalicoccus luteus]NJP37628.1 TlyA family RNA methyltransferase [Alkalicoccus luteus]
MKKERADILLVEQGLFESREKAKRAIMAGQVLADGHRVDKAGMKIPADSVLTMKGKPMPYVSRGGLKLEKALKEFDISLQGRIMLDIGSSTGGFTDCALQNGVELVYAVDVGSNQLVWKLRQDPKVVVMEKTNFRYCTTEDFAQKTPDFASVDVSFISLKHILPVMYDVLAHEAEAAVLVKPQFEAGREQVGRNGLVKDPAIHLEVLKQTAAFARQAGFCVAAGASSPIRGGSGNIEFLFHLVKTAVPCPEEPDFKAIVNKAHQPDAAGAENG